MTTEQDASEAVTLLDKTSKAVEKLNMHLNELVGVLTDIFVVMEAIERNQRGSR